MPIDRGAKTDARQRRALQRTEQQIIDGSLIPIATNGGLEYTGDPAELTVKVDDPLTLGANGVDVFLSSDANGSLIVSSNDSGLRAADTIQFDAIRLLTADDTGATDPANFFRAIDPFGNCDLEIQFADLTGDTESQFLCSNFFFDHPSTGFSTVKLDFLEINTDEPTGGASSPGTAIKVNDPYNGSDDFELRMADTGSVTLVQLDARAGYQFQRNGTTQLSIGSSSNSFGTTSVSGSVNASTMTAAGGSLLINYSTSVFEVGGAAYNLTAAASISVPTPTASAHAATKGYVDGITNAASLLSHVNVVTADRMLVYDASAGSHKKLETLPFMRWVEMDIPVATAMSTTQTQTLFQLPAGAYVLAAKLKHSSAYGTGGGSGYTLEIGITGNTTKYLSAFDVTTTPSSTNFQSASPQTFEDHATGPNVTVTHRNPGGNLSTTPQGTATMWLCIGAAE